MNIMDKVKDVLSPELFAELEEYIHSNCMKEYQYGYDVGYQNATYEFESNMGNE